MWEQLKSKHPSVIIYAKLDDFATIEVEKKVSKTSDLTHYVINIDIFDVTTQCVDIYRLDDVEKAMVKIRKKIEELYDDIPMYDEEEISNWIDEFIEEIDEF